ncbi:MAG: hypothetical protein J6V38_02840 [Kiritimatiellae bacterium]|nr:hypothetical protein [Kiritimatiellia bacterium]
MAAINWFALIFVVILPVGVMCGMAAVLIRDHIKARRRARRLHRPIDSWYELRVD